MALEVFRAVWPLSVVGFMDFFAHARGEAFGLIVGTGPWTERLMIRIGIRFVSLLVRAFTRPRIIGLENVPPGGGVLFLSNHISALDVLVVPWVIYSRYPKDLIRQAGKEELFEIPIVGWILRKWRGFPIKRGGADRKSIRMIEEYIREGKVILYPEGTRSRDGRIGRGNRMVGRIVKNTAPAVIPVALTGTDRVIPVGKTMPRRGARIEIRFGAPMDFGDECAMDDAKEASQRIIDRVMREISALHGDGGGRAENAEKKDAPGE